MGLYISYGATNKVTDEATVTHTLPSPIFKVGTHLIRSLQTQERGRWRYVGLTEGAATSAAIALISQFTEIISIPSISIDPVTAEGTVSYTNQTMCVADVSAYHVAGRMWEVSVDLKRPVYTWELVA